MTKLRYANLIARFGIITFQHLFSAYFRSNEYGLDFYPNRCHCFTPMSPQMIYFSSRNLMYLLLATQILRYQLFLDEMVALQVDFCSNSNFVLSFPFLLLIFPQVFYTVDKPSKNWKGGAGYISKDMATKGLPGPGEDTLILVSHTLNSESQPFSFFLFPKVWSKFYLKLACDLFL